MKLERHTTIPAPLSRVFPFFSRPENLAVITPSWLGFEIVSMPDGAIAAGDRIEYTIRLFGIPMRWVTRITRFEEGVLFTDVQEKGPYRKWVHTHTFREIDGTVEMDDVVEYELPFGIVGLLFGWPVVRLQLKVIFDYRESKNPHLIAPTVPLTSR